MYTQIPKYFKYENYIVTGCIVLVFILCGGKAHTQSLGDAVVKITFGSGTASRAGALSADSGSTTYTYSGSGEIGENYYTITNLVNTAVHGSFVTSYDHDYETTGNTNGYMMVVNGNITAGTVYTRTVSNLCGNTQYQFSVWIKNVLSTNGISPNMVFHIYAADGTTELGTPISTGDVPTGNVWHNYTANFTLPAGASNVIIKLVSNASGTVGNDFAVDDITFSPYGSILSTVFVGSTTNTETTCVGSTQTYTIKATSTLASGYVQKLQAYVNGSWTDLSTAGTATTFTITSPTAAGTYRYRLVSAITDNITSANCVVASNELTITVQAGATAAFNVNTNSCLGIATAFTDQTVSTGVTIASWLWDFGDGQTSTLQNPSHTYAQTGDYKVQLTVVNINGCSSAATAKTIHVGAVPVAKFASSVPDCATQSITFTDQSTTTEGVITSWLWDYGDGTATENRTSNAAFQHTFATAGTYKVTLVVSTTSGCANSKTNNITVSSMPVADFTIPGVCLDDVATFTDQTTIADNSNSSFTYQWNFGDGNSTAALNTSTQKNPTHKYSATGYYNVSLTVTTANGCAVTKVKTLTVSGRIPVASFIPGSTPLCSNREVFFINQSSVDFGNIAKVILYFDYDGDQTQMITDNSPYVGKVYRYSYPEFHTPVKKKYRVYMEAYSGGICGANTSQIINVLATPSVSFPVIADVCQNAGTVQLSVIPGTADAVSSTGVYSGTRVSSTGLFNPAAAGAGTFPIKYIYTSTNGCADTVSQNITVNPTPVISAGSNLTVLEGSNATIKAITGDIGLTYSWWPATFLSSTTVLNPIVTPTATTIYTLTATSTKGCSTTSMVTVTVLKTPIIPNTFTPNGDGYNDTWEIKYLDSYSGCTVDIYNRNGEKVFYSYGYPIAWDGRYRGIPLPVGVYYYVINPKHGRGTLSGSVTIIR